MTFSAIATSLLITLNAWFGVTGTPNHADDNWKIDRPWTKENSVYTVQARSKNIIDQCKNNPLKNIEFPRIIHGAHEVYLDSQLVSVFGDPAFQKNRSFYGSPTIPCSLIKSGEIVTWKAYSYSSYFSRIPYYPRLVSDSALFEFFGEYLYLLTAGSLVVLGLFSLVIFWGKVPNNLSLSVVLSCFFVAGYFICTVSGLFGLEISMLTAHRVADFCVWIGMSLFFNGLRLQKLLNKISLLIFAGHVSIACLIFLFATDGDSIQLGTTIPFGFGLLLCLIGLSKLLLEISKSKITRESVFELLSIGMFTFACINDVGIILYRTEGAFLLPVGLLSGLVFFALSVNEKINLTYTERDYLRNNLEREVERKTRELQQALTDLKTTQAELVQSAKLASLGSLSAGIAHEINNSLNYVYGSILPLERLVNGFTEDERKQKVLKLTKVMHEGLKLTFEIIKSLRNYTGLNQAKHNDAHLKEVLDSVLTILKSKWTGKIEVASEIPPDVKIFANVVGLHQVFMNLITNSIDAMPSGGKLAISVETEPQAVTVRLSDTGCGMPEHVKQKIFDPFFTTKEVGKGTGLGLHIVKMEMDKHHGSVEVDSKEGVGTTFILKFPVNTTDEARAVA